MKLGILFTMVSLLNILYLSILLPSYLVLGFTIGYPLHTGVAFSLLVAGILWIKKSVKARES